jgi:hypothetical protein
MHHVRSLTICRHRDLLCVPPILLMYETTDMLSQQL